jgi:acryloyl-coenzyme A reductase
VCFHGVSVRAGVLRSGVKMRRISGYEVSGVVVVVGTAVKGVRVGERVASTQWFYICGSGRYCRLAREPLYAEAAFLGDAGLNGGYAEYVSIEPDNLATFPTTFPTNWLRCQPALSERRSKRSTRGRAPAAC